MNAVVVGGRGRLRSDHVHDVYHAPELRAIVHHHPAAVLGVIGRKALVAVEAAFIGGCDLPYGNRHLRAVCAGPLYCCMQVKLQSVIWKISCADQLCALAAVRHLLLDHIPEEGVIPIVAAEFDEVKLGAHKVATSIRVSDELLEDSVFDLEEFIIKEFAQRIGEAEEAAFIHGDGLAKPLGIIHQLEREVITEKAGKISTDDLLELKHAIPSKYRKDAVFLMHDSTLRELFKLRTGEGQYQREYDALAAEHERLSEKIRSVEAQKKNKADRRRKIEIFLQMLETQEECMDFDPYTFVALIDKVVVGQDGKLDFCFRNGMKYEYTAVD